MSAGDATPSLSWIAASTLPLAVLEMSTGTTPPEHDDATLTHRWVNDAYAAVCGRPSDDLVGQPWSTVFGEQEPASARNAAPAAQDARAGASTVAHPLLAIRRPDDGGTRWVRAALTVRPPAEVSGETPTESSSWWLLQLVDVTPDHDEYARLRHRATHDTVTGLVNRTQFIEHVDQALRRLQRATDRHAAVVFLDLDRVKHVNDAYGHAAGDHVIVTTAERLREAVRPSDVVARLGGDEFTVLLEDLHDDDTEGEVSAIVERCLTAVSRPIDIGRQQTRVTASVGIALAVPDSSADDLLAAADAAMYQAKRAGRGRARFVDSHRPRHLSPRAALERQLYGALGRGELRVHYQPVIDLTTGTVSAAEALLRWQHPEHGLLPAGAFIDIATDAGLIGDIGSWVCSQTTSDLRGWDRQGARLDTLLLNIAGEQIVDDTLADQLRGCLTANDLDPSRICLEITETEITSSAATLQRLNELHDLGCVLAVDDFGTGYSSLSRLIDLPVDIVKIDRSFIADVGTDPRPTAVVSATLLMAHDLHQSVIAEGVENHEQHRWLQEAGCTHAQGHLLAWPMPADELPRVLGAR